MSIGIEKVPMGIFFDLKSVRKSGAEWSCGEKAIVNGKISIFLIMKYSDCLKRTRKFFKKEENKNVNKYIA